MWTRECSLSWFVCSLKCHIGIKTDQFNLNLEEDGPRNILVQSNLRFNICSAWFNNMHPFLTHRALVSVIDPLFTPALSFLLVRVTGWLSRWTSPTQSTLTLLAKVATTSRGWWRRRAATSISQTLTGTTRRRKATRFVQRQTWIVMYTLRCDGRDVYHFLFRELPHHMFSFSVIDRNIAPWLGLECKSNAVCCLECLIWSSVHNWFWKMFLICTALRSIYRLSQCLWPDGVQSVGLVGCCFVWPSQRKPVCS